MDHSDQLAQRFEQDRAHLRAVAYRMLGSAAEADDAVQEAWLRLNAADPTDVHNLSGWLTTVVARVCLDMLRSRTSRREQPLVPDQMAPILASDGNPEHEVVLADSVGPALLVVLDTLAPAERLAFVLHDLFAMPFDEIAPIVGRTPAAARQLASRARRRVQGADTPTEADLKRQRNVVAAFLGASRNGEFAALLAVLDPDVVVRADPAAVRMGGAAEIRGAAAVAESFSGRARAAHLAVIDGIPGAAWAVNGTPRVVFDFTVVGGRIVRIELLADPALLSELHLDLQPDPQ